MHLSFGKHAGKPLAEVPTSYLLWILRGHRSLDPALRRAIVEVLEDRGPLPPDLNKDELLYPATRDWPALIRRWYHGLVLDYHPDRGGSHEAMRAINEAHERLRKLIGI